MKLFKNKVGRPSNETKKKRKIFYGLIIGLSALLIIIVTSLFININKNKAFLWFSTPYVSISDDILGSKVYSGQSVNLKIKLRYSGKKTYYYNISASVGEKTKTGNCFVFPSKTKNVSYPLTVNGNNTYISITTYKDSSCREKVNEVSSKKYTIKTSDGEKKKIFTAYFYKNGADSIGSEKLTCVAKGNSCTVKAPNIVRKGYKVNGWSLSKYLLAKYKPGDTITLKKNMYFYAKTTKNNVGRLDLSLLKRSNVTMTIYTDEWKMGTSGNVEVKSSLSSDTVSLTSSNSKVMRLEKIDTNKWKMFAVREGSATIVAKTSSGAETSKTYTVKPYSYLGTSRMKKGCKSKVVISGVTIYRENGVTDSVYNSYLTDFKELPDYMYKNVKELFILSDSTFSSIYKNSLNADGITISERGYAVVDIRGNNYTKGCFGTIPHEFAHALDYGYSIVNGTGKLSSRNDWKNMYNYYNKNRSLAMRTYSYSNNSEFFADSYAFYFLKFQAKTHTFKNSWHSKYKYPQKLIDLTYDTLIEVGRYNW